MNEKEKLGKKLGHDLNLLYRDGMYLTARGWKRLEGLADMVLELVEEYKGEQINEHN